VFAVLCLAIFAFLCLSTAGASGRLSQAAAQSSSEYFKADAAAQQTFALLRQGQLPEGVSKQGDEYFYSYPVGKNLTLHVTLWQHNGQWQVLRWQTKDNYQQTTDNPPLIWDGVQDLGG